MKFTTAIISLLGAGAALATITPEQAQANVERADNVKRHDRAPGFAEADIPANARGKGSAEHVIKKE